MKVFKDKKAEVDLECVVAQIRIAVCTSLSFIASQLGIVKHTANYSGRILVFLT